MTAVTSGTRRPGPAGPTTQPIPRLPTAPRPAPAVPDWSRLGPPGTGPADALMPAFHAERHRDADGGLTDDTLIGRPPTPAPIRGWRLALWAASGGRINAGLGPPEAARQELVHRIRRPLPSTHHIAVVSVKGGVGKTTVAAGVGQVLAELRGDRTVVLDANPDAGTLAERLTGPGGPTVRDLFEDIPNLTSVAEVTRYTRLAGRLHVLGSEQEPLPGEAFTADEYLEVCELLARFYNIIVTDSGTGLVHSAVEATLATADSLVVVGAPTVDGASRASHTLEYLVDRGYRELAEQAMVVLCCDRSSPAVDHGRIRAHFAARCRAVVDVPPDAHLATGGRLDLAMCREETRDAFYLAAAYLADGFGARRPAPDGVGPA